MPTFRLDPSWPKVPAKWSLGSVSSASVDADDNVWILHRPHTLPADRQAMAAPSVLEFDNAGNFIQAWSAEGPGYEGTQHEHGIHVDYKGFVWVIGTDNVILKFTKAGKFVMQIGRRGQTGSGFDNIEYFDKPTAVKVYPKTNELFVTDGYGNRRVIVFDADTGKYKRHWGAYGRKPVDIGPALMVGVVSPRFFDPADPWRGYAENLQQFDTVQDIAISNDGLVYVADEGNKRIQVFTVDGKYISQQFVGVDNVKYLVSSSRCPAPPCHKPDLQSRSIAFSVDPQQKFLYVGGLTEIFILNRKTLEILGSFDTGMVEMDPPNHHMTTDREGNIYTCQTGLSGGGKPGTAQIQKFVLTGLSPVMSR
jgi:DNA-binding beta-propeller fold protein YncE